MQFSTCAVSSLSLLQKTLLFQVCNCEKKNSEISFDWWEMHIIYNKVIKKRPLFSPMRYLLECSARIALFLCLVYCNVVVSLLCFTVQSNAYGNPNGKRLLILMGAGLRISREGSKCMSFEERVLNDVHYFRCTISYKQRLSFFVFCEGMAVNHFCENCARCPNYLMSGNFLLLKIDRACLYSVLFYYYIWCVPDARVTSWKINIEQGIWNVQSKKKKKEKILTNHLNLFQIKPEEKHSWAGTESFIFTFVGLYFLFFTNSSYYDPDLRKQLPTTQTPNVLLSSPFHRFMFSGWIETFLLQN